MNLDQSEPLESTPNSFVVVLLGTVVLVVAVGVLLVYVLRKRGVLPTFAALRTTDAARLE